MGHEIDLGEYTLRTDLAVDVIGEDTKGIETKVNYVDNIKITDVLVLKEGSKIINKKEGLYITIEFEDVTDYENRQKVSKVFGDELRKMLVKEGLGDNDSFLIVGLGNNNSTPDSLGPKVAEKVLVTNHLFELGELEEGFARTYAFKPGVMGETGIETSTLVAGLTKKINPSVILVIDALASQSIERVNKTIQMTNSGIHPGSGVGNERKELSRKKLKVPVIAIGVPTVVDAVTIVSDTINYMVKHYSYAIQNMNNPANKLKIGSTNYLKKDIKTSSKDKKRLLGMIGDLSSVELRKLIMEVLTPIGYNLMVTPKEIDFEIDKISETISEGINHALHSKIV